MMTTENCGNDNVTLYTLRLHETLQTSFGICIMRVPGGWLYDCWDIETDRFKPGVFVPYDNEFQAVRYYDGLP